MNTQSIIVFIQKADLLKDGIFRLVPFNTLYFILGAEPVLWLCERDSLLTTFSHSQNVASGLSTK